ncbi:unnamed protein product [Moneuplotes crassus]|uniref:Uncharacterized protein n=1 Tax=Euplotes crassus TaxID=5936 RepID=A0AAD2D7P1_EUPCR|nr:unnamed protein product [Moneuplotes crassus]
MISSNFLAKPKPLPQPPALLSLTRNLEVIAYFAPCGEQGQVLARTGGPGEEGEERKEGICEDDEISQTRQDQRSLRMYQPSDDLKNILPLGFPQLCSNIPGRCGFMPLTKHLRNLKICLNHSKEGVSTDCVTCLNSKEICDLKYEEFRPLLNIEPKLEERTLNRGAREKEDKDFTLQEMNQKLTEYIRLKLEDFVRNRRRKKDDRVTYVFRMGKEVFRMLQ